MRVGNFSLMVPEGRERDSGHVVLEHGRPYTLRLGNHCHGVRCDAEVSVDGKPVGGFRVDAGQIITLERGADDSGRFTFFAVGTEEARQAGAEKVAVDQRGLIQVTFKPERERGKIRLTKTSRGIGGQSCGGGYKGSDEGNTTTDSAVDDGGEWENPKGKSNRSFLRTAGMGMLPQSSAGVTGLTGESSQQFNSVASLDYNPGAEVTISVRLVCGPAERVVRELVPAKRANDVPHPV